MLAPLSTPTPITHDSRFDDILQLSRRMLADASDGKWADIISMQSKRQRLMDLFFATPVPPEEAVTVANGIREMLDIVRELIDHSKQAMSGLSTDLNKINHGMKAQQAYADNM